MLKLRFTPEKAGQVFVGLAMAMGLFAIPANAAVQTTQRETVQRQTVPRQPVVPPEQVQPEPTVREVRPQTIQPRTVDQIRRPGRLTRTPRIENLELLEQIGSYDRPLNVYRVSQQPRGLEGRMQELIGRLGRASDMSFDGQRAERVGESRMSMRHPEDPSAVFEYDRRTGNFLFNAGLMKLRDEATTPNLPNQGALPRLAARHLAEIGVEPAEAEMQVVHLGGLNMAIPNGSGGSTVFEKLKTVRFHRILDGLPVEGDTRLVMHLGEGGALSGLVYQWPDFGRGQPLSTSLMVDPQTLRQQAMQRMTPVIGGAQRSWLTNVELVLYDDGRGTMEPAYHVVLNRMMALGEGEPAMIPFDFYLPVSAQPRAVFPFMQQAERAPERGEDEGEVRNASDE
jgi:hypothetical protein